MKYHVPVLREEVLQYLCPGDKRLVVDGTLGDGGHTEYILQHSECRILGIDRDASALARAKKRLAPFGERVTFHHGNFSELKIILQREGIMSIDGLVLDLGFSSPQIDTPERGFSFMRNGPLDMRMDTSSGITAAELLTTLSGKELEELIKTYGEERHSRKIVRAIRQAQAKTSIVTTRQLADLISAAIPSRPASIHPATRAFQALRIAINDELTHLRIALRDSLSLLRAGGRLVVISFHSLEDRIVKRFFQTEVKDCICPPRMPACVCGHKQTLKVLTRKPVTPAPSEIIANPRAGSARLRAAERVYA